MGEADIGKVFLFPCQWDWTFVGRFAGYIGDRLIIHQAGYFTRTGATFDVLCKDGFVAGTRFHRSKVANGEIRIPDGGPVFPWEADWPQPERENR